MMQLWNHLGFFQKYALNLTAGTFPAMTRRRRNQITTDLEIIMLGDSHGWGQGAAGFDGLRAFYSAHMAYPYSQGFYARVKEHIQEKKGIRPMSLIPMSEDGVLRSCGIFHRENILMIQPVMAAGFYSALTRTDSSFAHLGHLATEHKFGNELCIVEPEYISDGTRKAEWAYEMVSHASKVYIGVLAGRNGAKLEVDLQTPPYYSRPEGYPKVYRVTGGKHDPLKEPQVQSTPSGSIIIDTYEAAEYREQVICIDYGKKHKGTLAFRYAGAHEQADSNHADWAELTGQTPCSDLHKLSQPVLMIRGIVFDGNNIRNFSMGGHTVGQWLGDGTSSYNDGPYPHIDEILSFVPFTPSLAIIQAPVVNEYLRQTPLTVFKNNLDTLIRKLGDHHNKAGNREMDVLMFTTLGDQRVQFEGEASLPISYPDYFQTVKQYCLEGGYGLIDFQQYFCDTVQAGLLDVELLFDDAIHPGPFANEFIAQGLQAALDRVM